MGKLLVVYGTRTSVKKYFLGATGDLLYSRHSPVHRPGLRGYFTYFVAVTSFDAILVKFV